MTTYGIYRERARSAVLSTVMLDREAAIKHAELLSVTGHGPTTIRPHRATSPAAAIGTAAVHGSPTPRLAQ